MKGIKLILLNIIYYKNIIKYTHMYILLYIIYDSYFMNIRNHNKNNSNCRPKGSGKEVKIQQFMHRDRANVEPEMYDCTSYNWSHWNSNEKLKEKSGSYTSKTFDRFTTANSYTWNITHNTESTAVRNLKCERWGSPLVQE
jgi:hypothetical protein